MSRNLHLARKAVEYVQEQLIIATNRGPLDDDYEDNPNKRSYAQDVAVANMLSIDGGKYAPTRKNESGFIGRTRGPQEVHKELFKEIRATRGIEYLRKKHDALPGYGSATAPSELGNLLNYANTATMNGFGNCQEMAAIAFLYLWKRNVRPLDVVKFNRGDHLWVVVGSPHATPWPRTADEWSLEPVWCDPWLESCFRIKDLIEGNYQIEPPPRYHFQTWEQVLSLEPTIVYRVT